LLYFYCSIPQKKRAYNVKPKTALTAIVAERTKKQKKTKLLVNDRSIKQAPNLPYPFIHPIADIHQPNYAIAPTLVTPDSNGTIDEEHRQVNKILHQFKSHIPAESDSLDKWSEFVQTDNSIYHRDPDINNILKISSVSTAQYNHYKTTALTLCFKAIANNLSLAPLTMMMVDCHMRSISRFFLLCRGTCTSDKKDVVNACVLVYSLSLKIKKFCNVDVCNIPKEVAAQSQLQPNTVSKIHRTLFKIFKGNDVNYNLGDFKHDSTFYAVWNKIFDDACKYRDDFGNKPQQAVVDLHDFQKMTNLEPPLPPEENYNDMLLVLLYKVAQVFCLLAGQVLDKR
jgi:hypothetical protein